jgi:hypothetical protein
VDIHVLEKSKSAMIKTIKKDFYKKEKKLQWLNHAKVCKKVANHKGLKYGKYKSWQSQDHAQYGC